MDIHKPKPVHNLREFLKEYGIIVLGVLTALGLEQAIESWHERARLEETTQAIEVEIRTGLASAQIMADMQACQGQQLAVLSDAVGKNDLARARRVLADPRIFLPLPFDTAAWRSALASDVGNDFDQRQRAAYDGLFYILERNANWQSDYFRSQARLSGLTLSGLSQSPSARAAAVSEVAEMASILGNMQGSLQAYRSIAEQGRGMTVTRADIDALPVGRNNVAQCKAAAKEFNSPPAGA